VGFGNYAGRKPTRHRSKKGTVGVKKKHKHQHTGGEVTELARETAKVEQYWIVGDRSEPHNPPKNYDYVEELINLQIELIKFQEYVRLDRFRPYDSFGAD
jgi:hypothetical protein